MTAPSDSKIGELLEKLRELDWETYRKYRASMNIGGVILEGEVTLYLLQGVIQDAIAARRKNQEYLEQWFWNIDEAEKNHFIARIYLRRGPFVSEGEGITAAEAITNAYVAALEAEETR